MILLFLTVVGGYGPPQGVDPTVYQWFVSVDVDRSGRINDKELLQALGNAPWARFSAETCRIMISMQYLSYYNLLYSLAFL
jgi:hypothetical protein